MDVRELRRDRAARLGTILFAYERAFDDISERLEEVNRRFESALLVGTPDPSWPDKLGRRAGRVTAIEPGAVLAKAAGALHVREEDAEFPPAHFDLCVAVGTLDTVGDLPGMLMRIRSWLRPDSLLIGAIPGGDTLPQLRAAIRAADGVLGGASPHVHPRIEASALGHLLTAAGFAMPVVDVDRMPVAYPTLSRLVADLRGMAVTNVLRARARPLNRSAFAAAENHFKGCGDGGRTVETFEILHFAAWTPKSGLIRR